MTLQLRLTLTFLVLAGVAVVALGGGTYLVARDRVYGSVDESLSAQAQAIVSSIATTDESLSQGAIERSRRSLDLQAAQGYAFRIMNLSGEILYSTGETFFNSSAQPQVGFRDLPQADARSRVLITPILTAGQPVGYVETSTSLAQADESLAEIRRALIFGGFFVASASAVAAFFMAGRAVRPVAELAHVARGIERTADFSRRLSTPASTLEMKEMVSTFNRMIERVERMVDTQRSFLSDTSHELRRPLTILRTDIDVINDPGLTDAERESIRREMSDVAESMSNLISQLLMLARQSEDIPQRQWTDLSSLCRSSLKSVAQSYPSHEYVCDVEEGLICAVDPEKMGRVVTNLLENAAAYTEPPGQISLRLLSMEGKASIQITDSGSGMTAEEIERAFERFYRGRDARRARPDGLGLGLAMVKQIVESHQGSVAISSRPGKGTEVTVQLPAEDS